MININSSAIMVTYNPEEETVKVIENLLSQSLDLIVVDNGSEISNIFINKIKDLEFLFSNLHFISNENNLGLAGAQNLGIQKANEINNKYLFFFDQDTLIPNNYVSVMENAYEEYCQSNSDSKLGILAPNYKDKNIGEYAHFAKLTNKSYEDLTIGEQIFIEVSFVISSGSMFELSTIIKNGYFLNGFFIDQIDTEYCLRLLKDNYKIIATSKAMLTHTIGDREKKRFFNLIIKPNHHSAKRKYTIFRNGIITIKEYGNFYPGFTLLMIKRFVHDILGIVLFEKEKLFKINMVLKGIKDGVKTNYDDYK